MKLTSSWDLAKSLHLFVLLTIALLMGCGSSVSSRSDVPEQEGPDSASMECTTGAALEFLVFDCWGRPVANPAITEGSLTWEFGGDNPTAMVTLSAESLVPATITATLDDEEGSGLILSASGGTLVTWDQDLTEDGCRRYTVAIGLDHPWLACQATAPTYNSVTLFTNGEELFAKVAEDVAKAESRIHATTWWWQSNFELVKPEDHHLLSAEQRWPNTVLAHLEAKTIPEIRVMVARFAPSSLSGLAYINSDPELRAHVYDDGDGFEVMSQGNHTEVPFTGTYEPVEHPIPFLSRVVAANPSLADRFPGYTETSEAALSEAADAASWHQKLWAIDGAVAYVSGMNIKSTDWDRDAHLVFEPKRMKYNSSTEERLLVKEKKSRTDLLPRKDYGVRLEGPAAWSVDRIIKQRWDLAIEMAELFSDHATPFELMPMAQENGPTYCQVQVTHPEPMGERSILESMDKAIRNARDLIYIEDQYFRMPIVLDAFRAALQASPNLRVVVITKPVADADPAKKWTVIMDEEMKAAAGDRYLLLKVMAYDEGYLSGTTRPEPVFEDIDVHSKIILVDDTYISVGSCNKNNRGLLLEGEANVAIWDRDFVRPERQRLLALVSGDSDFDWNSSGAKVLSRMKTLAQDNQQLKLQAEELGEVPASRPFGFLYPLEFTPDYVLDLGPDLF